MDYRRLCQETKERIEKLKTDILKIEAVKEALDKELANVEKLANMLEKLQNDAQQEMADKRNPVRLKKNALCLLRLLETEKSMNTISAELKRAESSMKEATLYAMLSYYKRQFGFIESSQRGTYKLTEKGSNYLREKYPKELNRSGNEGPKDENNYRVEKKAD